MSQIENRNMIKMLARGQTSHFGFMVFDYANKLVIASLGHRANFFMGLYQAGEVIAGLIFNIIGGVIADSYNRKRLLITTDLLAALTTFIVFICYSNHNTWLLIVTNIILAILYAFNNPTYKAIVKDLLSKEQIYRYNSYAKTISECLSVVTPFIGMLIIFGFGYRYGMLVNSLAFLVSAGLEFRFNILATAEGYSQYSGSSEGFLEQLKAGFSYIYQDKALLIVLVGASVINFFFAGYAFSLPFVDQISGLDKLFAYMLISESAGNILGASFNTFWKKDLAIRAYSHFLLVSALPLVVMPLFGTNLWLVLALCALSSAGMTIFNIQMMSNIQATVNPDYLGRVFSVIFTIAMAFMPLGTLFFTWLNLKSWLVFGLVGLGELVVYLFMVVSLSNINDS